MKDFVVIDRSCFDVAENSIFWLLNFGGDCVGAAGRGDGVTVAQGSIVASAAGATTVSSGLMGVKECGFECATFTRALPCLCCL
jgi:hypothetical protein